ncbi:MULTISPECIES: DUF2273 domain-containing protein [Saccharibacillus]|uniref:DUF2273 domain-containing protein n=1 Tax=Saccharibacillus brassicae TaxID=2583377 RepID=A0A4Y6US62_SACBS|nr:MULTISPECIES: DUF2273 domain-containing protein [Saccharibacillus]MWJ31772.1 DUF2273 domain-containing protein [Saccharibacillus sp. WB 17]QDH19600.1 DUF2273 domain-containing protein [Saccharibacillus brassicae]
MKWSEIWTVYGGRLAWTAAGLFFGLLYLAVGFWHMLVVALLTLLGYGIGSRKDRRAGPLLPWGELRARLMERWRPFR